MRRNLATEGTTLNLNERWAQVTTDIRNAEIDLYDLFERYSNLQAQLHALGDDRALRFNAPLASYYDEWVRLGGAEPSERPDVQQDLHRILDKLA